MRTNRPATRQLPQPESSSLQQQQQPFAASPLAPNARFIPADRSSSAHSESGLASLPYQRRAPDRHH